jgi:hypothetical protein
MAGVDISFLNQLSKGLASRLGIAIPPLDIDTYVIRAVGRIPSLASYTPWVRGTKCLNCTWREALNAQFGLSLTSTCLG